MRASPPIRVLIVDDHVVVRMGLVSMLSLEADIEIVAEADDAQEAVGLCAQHQPDLTLLDVRMPGLGGLKTLRAIRAAAPQARVIMLSTSDLDEDVVQAVEAGAMGYVLKTASQEALVAAVRGAHGGEPQFCAEAQTRLAQHRHLSNREVAVLEAAARGLCNKEIAAELEISEHTVKTYVKAILSKFEVADRAGAVAVGFARGFLKIP